MTNSQPNKKLTDREADEQKRVRLQDETRITGGTGDPLAGLSAAQIKAERDAAKLGPLLALQLALLVANRKKGHE